MVSWIGQIQEMLQDTPKHKRMKSVSQNSGVVDKSSAGHIFTLALTVLALCGHHLETYIHYLKFFLATRRIGIVLLRGMWLFCVPALPPSMVFCYTIVSRWTCWNALCKSVTAPCISAREMSEMQELLPSHHGSQALESGLWRTRGLGCWPTLSNAQPPECASSHGLNSSFSDQEREFSPWLGMFECCNAHWRGHVWMGKWTNAWCLQMGRWQFCCL